MCKTWEMFNPHLEAKFDRFEILGFDENFFLLPEERFLVGKSPTYPVFIIISFCFPEWEVSRRWGRHSRS